MVDLSLKPLSSRELIRFVWKFVRQQKWIFLFILVLDSLAWPLDALLWPYILHLVIDIFTRFEGDRLSAWQVLKGPILAGLGLVIFVEVASRTMGFLMARAIPKIQAAIRMHLFDHIQRHSPHYFNERFAGSLANKITDMTSQVELLLSQLFWPLIPATMTCFLGTFFLWAIHPIFAAILIIWIALHLSICLLSARPCDKAEHRHAMVRTTLLGKIVDSLTNNFAVNLFFRFNFEKHALHPVQKEEMETNITAKKTIEKMRCITSGFFFAGIVVALFGSLLYLWTQNQISTGQVAQVFNTAWNIAGILWTVGSALPLLFQSFGSAKQAYSVMLDPQDIQDKKGSKELLVTKGEIVFENVSFQYGEQKLFEKKHVTLQGGERVGLVGYTGAGKSTFVSLILRFHLVQQGKILIDDQDISHVTLESLRRQIALIPQDPLLFHRTLWDNIAYGNPKASSEEVLHAAKLAHCDEFIHLLPKAYEAKVGERGTKLSGGEKQRIAIARAILANAPILILDEATSALDSITENYIQDSLEKLMEGRTSLVIAHRLSTLSRMDRILVFDKGKIVEQGTHASLLEKNGLYSKMWKMQVGGFLPL